MEEPDGSCAWNRPFHRGSPGPETVTDLTNELLKKNAQALHLASTETAKESERGIVDIETLKQTNQELISTLMM